MTNIIVEDVPNNIAKQYGKKVKFSYNLFPNNIESSEIDFRELKNSEITPEIIKSIKNTKQTPKKNLNCLSKEYANL